MHVDIKIRVYLRCAENNNIQAVRHRAACTGRSIVRCGNLTMARVAPYGFNRLQIEALNIQQGFEAAFVEHIHHIARDAAEAEAAAYFFGKHNILKIFCRRKGCSARARLEREAFLQQTGSFYNVHSRHCHQQTDGIAGDFCCSGNDSVRVTDGLHRNDLINIRFGDRPFDERIGMQFVGDNNNMLCTFCVRNCIAQRAAGGFADFARAIAHCIRSRRGDKSNIYRSFSVFDIAGSAAVRAELNGVFHSAGRNKSSEFPGHVVRLERCYNTVFDMFLKRTVRIKE